MTTVFMVHSTPVRPGVSKQLFRQGCWMSSIGILHSACFASPASDCVFLRCSTASLHVCHVLQANLRLPSPLTLSDITRRVMMTPSKAPSWSKRFLKLPAFLSGALPRPPPARVSAA